MNTVKGKQSDSMASRFQVLQDLSDISDQSEQQEQNQTGYFAIKETAGTSFTISHATTRHVAKFKNQRKPLNDTSNKVSKASLSETPVIVCKETTSTTKTTKTAINDSTFIQIPKQSLNSSPQTYHEKDLEEHTHGMSANPIGRHQQVPTLQEEPPDIIQRGTTSLNSEASDIEINTDNGKVNGRISQAADMDLVHLDKSFTSQ